MGNMAEKQKTEESKTEEIKEKFSEVKETVKEKFEECKEKASEGVDAVKEKASEVMKTVKGETEEEKGDSRMLIALALLGAWGSGYLAGNDADLAGAVLLGGENFSVINFSSDQVIFQVSPSPLPGDASTTHPRRRSEAPQAPQAMSSS